MIGQEVKGDITLTFQLSFLFISSFWTNQQANVGLQYPKKVHSSKLVTNSVQLYLFFFSLSLSLKALCSLLSLILAFPELKQHLFYRWVYKDGLVFTLKFQTSMLLSFTEDLRVSGGTFLRSWLMIPRRQDSIIQHTNNIWRECRQVNGWLWTWIPQNHLHSA